MWYSNYGVQPVKKPCPLCFGTKEVTLILGNGDEVILECTYCTKGFEAPTGCVTEYEYVATAEQRTITTINSTITANGEEHEYMCGYARLNNEDVFDTEEEALAHSKYKEEEARKEQETKIEYLKAKASKGFSWNAGYWLRQIRDAKRDIESWEKKAILCKTRARK